MGVQVELKNQSQSCISGSPCFTKPPRRAQNASWPTVWARHHSQLDHASFLTLSLTMNNQARMLHLHTLTRSRAAAYSRANRSNDDDADSSGAKLCSTISIDGTHLHRPNSASTGYSKSLISPFRSAGLSVSGPTRWGTLMHGHLAASSDGPPSGDPPNEIHLDDSSTLTWNDDRDPRPSSSNGLKPLKALSPTPTIRLQRISMLQRSSKLNSRNKAIFRQSTPRCEYSIIDRLLV